MAAMKPRTGDGPLEVTKEGRGIVMRVPLEGGGRLVVELTPDEADAARRRAEERRDLSTVDERQAAEAAWTASAVCRSGRSLPSSRSSRHEPAYRAPDPPPASGWPYASAVPLPLPPTLSPPARRSALCSGLTVGLPGLDLDGVDPAAALSASRPRVSAGEVVAVPLPSGATRLRRRYGRRSTCLPCAGPHLRWSAGRARSPASRSRTTLAWSASAEGGARRRRGTRACGLHVHAALRAQAVDAARRRAAGPPARDRAGGLRAADSRRPRAPCSPAT